MEFSNQSLQIIEEAHILKQEDLDVVLSLKEELQDTFLHAQVFRTRTEMEASVLNDLKFPTPDSKYWQAIREQNVMFDQLVMLSYEYRKNNTEIKMLKRDMLNTTDALQRELLQIEIERKEYVRLQQERTAKDRIREIKEWHEIKESLLPDMLCGTENVDEHQLLSYTLRWCQQLGGLSESTGVAERNNLIGQVQKGLRLCRKYGVIQKVYDFFPNDRKVLDKIAGFEEGE